MLYKIDNLNSKKFIIRTISSLLMLPLMIFVWNGGTLFNLILSIIYLGMIYETINLINYLKVYKLSFYKKVFIIIFSFFPIIILINFPDQTLLLNFSIIFFILVIFKFAFKMWLTILMIILTLFSALSVISLSIINPKIVFYLLLLIIVSDVSAYISGNIIGGKKILPIISPNKTWSGSIGSLVFCGFFSYLLSLSFSFIICLVLGVIISISSQLGDLLESAVKRKSGYKDSGFIIPGHGGILDRMDGALISFPVMYLLIYFDILKLNL